MGRDRKRKAKAKQARKLESEATTVNSTELDATELAQETIGGHPKGKAKVLRTSSASGAIKKKKIRVSLNRMKASRRHLAR
jgi:hypothetical protein